LRAGVTRAAAEAALAPGLPPYTPAVPANSTRPAGSADPAAPPALASTQNLNVAGFRPLITPAELTAEMPVTPASHATVVDGRSAVEAALRGEDPRLIVVVGPCSIHDVDAARAYAERLARLNERLSDKLVVVMRVYFEKPRTTTGWKGLINDPHLDGSFDIAAGLRLARRLLLDVTAMGLAAGTEFLDPITPQYLDDLVSWAAIGARTTESQTHRQMASGLSMPVGYKNATTGDVQTAVNAMVSARAPHHFLGIDEDGRAVIVETRGNPYGHLILRGGSGKPNYHPDSVADAAATLGRAGLPPRLMVDCSHANSGKRHEQQEIVFASLLDQVASASASGGGSGGGGGPVIGAMLESNLDEGSQPIPDDRAALKYGVSITDACIGWDKTEQLLLRAAEVL